MHYPSEELTDLIQSLQNLVMESKVLAKESLDKEIRYHVVRRNIYYGEVICDKRNNLAMTPEGALNIDISIYPDKSASLIYIKAGRDYSGKRFFDIHFSAFGSLENL